MAITPENPNAIPKPTAISGEADAGINTPTVVNPEADSGISTPVTVTPEADAGVSTPTVVNPEADSGIATPSTVTPEVDTVISTPSAVTPEADSAIATPSAVSSEAIVNPTAPSAIAPLAPSGINRALVPLFNFNASLGLPDSVTYSRSSSASYIEEYRGPLGRFQKRITNDYVGSVTNNNIYSEQIDNAAYIKTNGSVNTNVTVAPNGTRTANKILPDATNATHNINQNLPVVLGVIYTFSIYAKASEYRFLQLFGGGGTTIDYANFDLLNGVVANGDFFGTEMIPSITYEQNGWYRCSFTFTATANTNTAISFVAIPSSSLTRNPVFAGDGQSGILVWGAQVTESAKILPYVRTFDIPVTETFTANPRYEEKGLLVEGASTNLILRSEEINNAAWTKTNGTATANNTLAPDGSFSGDRIDTTANDFDLKQGFAVVGGTNYTTSIFVKRGNISVFRLIQAGTGVVTVTADYDVSNLTITPVIGTAVDYGIEEFNDGWYRISITTLSTGAGFIDHRLFIPNINSFFYLWGAQAEALPFATSYIRTEGATVSRAKEIITASASLPTNKVTAFAEYSYPTLANRVRYIYSFNDGSRDNRIALLSTSATGNPRAVSDTGGVSITDLESTTALVADTPVETAFVIERTPKLFQDGVLNLDSVNVAQLINYTNINIGGDADELDARALFGHIKRLEIYDTALTANEVKKL
jgi:hypothetical protein